MNMEKNLFPSYFFHQQSHLDCNGCDRIRH